MGYIADFKVKKRIGVISGDEDAYSLQINLVSWNGGLAKFDLRRWNPEGKPQKGLVMTEDEAKVLVEKLADYFRKREDLNDTQGIVTD